MASLSTTGDPSRRFRDAAAYYLKGRPPYAATLIGRVAALVGLDRWHAVLDLGCGPGVLARAFAKLADHVVAMDPEPAMLREAAAYCAGIERIRLVAGDSGDLAPSLGRFRLVVMGRSFHWMDRAKTLRRLDGLIEPGGAVVHFHTSHAEVPANAWMEPYRALRRRHTGDRPGRPGITGEPWLPHEAFLLASAFCRIEAHTVYESREFAAETLVDRVFSMSTSTRELLGTRAEPLERDIRALIGDVAPDGRLSEVVASTALIGRRVGEDTPP